MLPVDEMCVCWGLCRFHSPEAPTRLLIFFHDIFLYLFRECIKNICDSTAECLECGERDESHVCFFFGCSCRMTNILKFNKPSNR